MKKYSLALFCLLALSACDSSSTDDDLSADNTDGATDTSGSGTNGGDADADGGDTVGGDASSDGDDTSGGGTGSGGGAAGGGDDDTIGGDTDSGEGDTSGDNTGSSGDDASTCDVPDLGHVFTQDSSVLTDGCINTGMIDVAAATSAGLYHTLFPGLPDVDPNFDVENLPADVKGLYLYTQGSSPGYVVPYTTVGFYNRAGRIGFVTRGPGRYYLALNRASSDVGTVLNGLSLAVWSATSGAVNLTEVTWAHIDDDVTSVAKLHWRSSDLEPLGSYSSQNLLTLAASGHGSRAITHELSEEVVGQYLSLIAADCPAHDGASEVPAVRFIDATGELGQAWSGTDLVIATDDDPTRLVYMIALDWNHATQATMPEILTSIQSKSFLWPDPGHPNVLSGVCSPSLTLSTRYFDGEGNPTLDGLDSPSAEWLH